MVLTALCQLRADRMITQLVLQLVLFSSHHSAWLFICEIKTDTHK